MTVRPYPFDQLPRVTRAEAALESAFAGWLATRPMRSGLAALAGGPVQVTAIRAVDDSPRTVHALDATVPGSVAATARGQAPTVIDPHMASCSLRIAGSIIEVRGSSRGVRRLAQKLLGGPAELDAPRPLTLVEQQLWAHVVATALDDLAIAAEVVPELRTLYLSTRSNERNDKASESKVLIDLVVAGSGLSVELRGADVHGGALELRVPPARPAPAWVAHAMIDVPVVVGRCALARDTVGGLAVRDVITLDRAAGDAELVIFGGAVGLRVAAGAVSAAACTGYVRRDMSLPDDAHVELTVALGTTAMSLRQVLDLAVGQIVSLGRPLAGPFELRAAGRIVGRGELIDVDGELGVRIVSLES